MAHDNKNDVGIQLKIMALVKNSLLIAGSATLMDDDIKGVKKDDIIAIIKAGILTLLLFSIDSPNI